MAHSKRKSAADGNRQRTLGNPQSDSPVSQPIKDVKPTHIEVISQDGSTRVGWIEAAERWWSSRPDCAVWRTRTCLYVYFVVSLEA